MPDYRLYRMNPYSGHIDAVEQFHSGDDVEAICLVRARADRVPIELWQGARKLIHIDPKPQVAACVPIPEPIETRTLLRA